MGRVSTPTPTRPRQVTLAAWLIMGGSVIVVAMVFDRVAGLHTIETRESVERFLAEPPGADIGVGVDGVITMLRTLAMVAAGCATAAGILGYQVLRRSRSARLALTVLAVPLFLTGMVTGGFVSSIVAASAVMLWLQPARDWFNGVTRQGSARAAAAGTPPSATAAPQQALSVAVLPPGAGPAERPVASPRRPAAVVWACALTWVFSGLTALGMIASAIALAIEPDRIFDEARQQNPELTAQGVSDGVLSGVAYAMVAGIVLWCVSAIVIAVLVFRRVEWARIVLVVSASTAAAVSLAGTVFGAFLLLFPLIAGVVTLALLVRPETTPWFKRPSP